MVDRSVAVKRKAQQLLQKGDVGGAITEYEKLFEGGDKDPYDFIVVADLLAKRGSMQEAVRRYRQAIEEYAKTELYKNAIAVCKKILRISKEDLAIHRTLGELYAKEGLFGDAQIHFLEFAEGSIRRQDHDAALGVLDEVLKLSPDNDDLSEKYVEIAMRADQPDRAGKELLRRSERVMQSGRHAEAEQIRERVSTLAPGLLTSFHAAPVSPASPVAAADAAASMDAPPPHAHAGFDPSSRALSYDAPTAEEAAVEEPPAPAPAHAVPERTPEPERTPKLEPEEVLAQPEPEAHSHEELAEGYLQAGNRDLAAEEYWKASETAFFRGDLPRARQLLQALLGVEPTHEAALRRLVELTEKAGDIPAESKARFDLAEVYLEIGRAH